MSPLERDPDRCAVCGRNDRLVCDVYGHIGTAEARARTTTRRDPTPAPLPAVGRSHTEPDLLRACITASALRSLAIAMDRLAAWHRSRGGPSPDEPCLKSVTMEAGCPVARVTSGGVVTYKLEYLAGEWQFR